MTRHAWSHSFLRECTSLGFHYEFREIERPSGTSSILYLASQTPDPNKVLCFLHGFGDDLFFPGSRLFLHLLQSGWDILTCDLDGHGKGGTAKFDKNRSLSNLEPLLSFFENKYPGRPKLHLCGFSFGAATMLKYAVHNPEHIASLTLLGMPLGRPRKISAHTEFLGFCSKAFINTAQRHGYYASLPALGRFKRWDFPIRLLDSSQVYYNQAFEILQDLRLEDLLRVVTFPTLYCFGKKDSLVISSADHFSSKLVRALSPNIELHMLENATHFTTLLEPHCWKRVEIFLRTHARST